MTAKLRKYPLQPPRPCLGPTCKRMVPASRKRCQDCSEAHSRAMQVSRRMQVAKNSCRVCSATLKTFEAIHCKPHALAEWHRAKGHVPGGAR